MMATNTLTAWATTWEGDDWFAIANVDASGLSSGGRLGWLGGLSLT